MQRSKPVVESAQSFYSELKQHIFFAPCGLFQDAAQGIVTGHGNGAAQEKILGRGLWNPLPLPDLGLQALGFYSELSF